MLLMAEYAVQHYCLQAVDISKPLIEFDSACAKEKTKGAIVQYSLACT